MTQWTFEALAKRLGAVSVPGVPLRGRDLAVDARRGVARTSCDARQAICEIQEGRGAKYVIIPLESLPADVQNEAPVPTPCHEAAWIASNLWLSPGGAVTPLHFDIPHNFLVQVRGQKRVIVFERGQFGALYPEPPWSSVPNFSRVDPLRPDINRFPAFHDAQAFVAVLDAGDVLFLPAATWHHVTSESNSISVNHWWARGVVSWMARSAHEFKRLRGIR